MKIAERTKEPPFARFPPAARTQSSETSQIITIFFFRVLYFLFYTTFKWMSLDIWALRIHWENNCPNLQDAAPPTRFTLVSELTDSFPLPLFGLDVIAVSIQKYQLKTNTHTLVQPQSLTASDPLLVQNYSIGNYWNSISLLGKSAPLKKTNMFFVSQWTVCIEGASFQNLYTNRLKKKKVPLNHIIEPNHTLLQTPRSDVNAEETTSLLR